VDARLIAKLVSVHKVPFAVQSLPAFRELQGYYLGSAVRTVKSGLVIFPAKIRTKFLPLWFEEAVERSLARISRSPLREQFTLAEDGCASRRKTHYKTVTIGAPVVPAEIVALCPVSPSELLGVSIARTWEMLILPSHRGAPLEDCPLGFALRLPRSPSAVISDSADPNVRAPAITSQQHLNNLSPLPRTHLCVDLRRYITSSSHHAVIAQSQRVVHFFNFSTSVWLPLLRAEVTRTLAKSLSLLFGCRNAMDVDLAICCLRIASL
jgi:hypothetical protein